MAEKNKKHTGTKEQMDAHAHNIITLLEAIEGQLRTLVYYSQPSRGFAADVEKAAAQPYVNEGKALKDKIRAIATEELRKLNEENK
jgi:hypothetical protein